MVTAEVYSPEGALLSVAGPDEVAVAGIVVCRGVCPIGARLSGEDKRGRDVLRVSAPRIARGGEVRLQKKGRDGHWTQVGRTKRLDAEGDRGFSVPDLNGRSVTKYRAVLSPTRDLFGDTTPVVRLR